VPGAGHDGELLSRRKRALLTVEHERDPPRPELYMLDKVVVHVLAAGDKAACFDGEVGDDTRAAALRGGLDDHRLLAGQRVPDDVARAHQARLTVRAEASLWLVCAAAIRTLARRVPSDSSPLIPRDASLHTEFLQPAGGPLSP
jgi:hypothetical protein